MNAFNVNALPIAPETAAPTPGIRDRIGSERADRFDFAAALARILAGQSTPDIHAPAETLSPATHTVETGLDDLAPEFRTRLERVIARMEELGHSVQVVETYREQSRQEWLFEQGRTRPGPIVTWTRDSNHTHGRAADLIIDGRYDGPGYQTLQLIAEQEGLRTLGPRDPGHVELPRNASPRHAEPRPFLAPVAEVARVAETARIARTAAVAEIAHPAEPARTAAVAVQGTAGSDRADSRESNARDEGTAAFLPEASRLTAYDAASAVATAATTATDRGIAASSIAALERTSDADIASRIARVLDLQEAGARQPLSSVVLRLAGFDSGADTIRVARRGIDVNTSIDVTDPLRAQDLLGRLHELRAALETHGLRPDVSVQVTPAERVQEQEALRQDPDGQPRQRPRRDHQKQEER